MLIFDQVAKEILSELGCRPDYNLRKEIETNLFPNKGIEEYPTDGTEYFEIEGEDNV